MGAFADVFHQPDAVDHVLLSSLVHTIEGVYLPHLVTVVKCTGIPFQCLVTLIVPETQKLLPLFTFVLTDMFLLIHLSYLPLSRSLEIDFTFGQSQERESLHRAVDSSQTNSLFCTKPPLHSVNNGAYCDLKW